MPTYGSRRITRKWILDDYAYYGFDWSAYSYHRISDQDVFEIYKAKFDVAYDERTLFLLTMHPFVTGHQSRILVLDRLIEYIQSKAELVRDATTDRAGGCSAAYPFNLIAPARVLFFSIAPG